MTTCCPTCHQPLATMRAGVRLPVLKAKIFDAIHAAGEIGISSKEVMHAVYRGRKRPRYIDTIRMHVIQINDLLVETDTVIRSIDRGATRGRAEPPRWIVTKARQTVGALR